MNEIESWRLSRITLINVSSSREPVEYYIDLEFRQYVPLDHSDISCLRFKSECIKDGGDLSDVANIFSELASNLSEEAFLRRFENVK